MKKNERYNEGVASGIKVAQKIIEKEAETLDYLKNQIDKIFDKQSGMRDAVEAVISYQNNEAISKYYGLYNQKSPKELSEYEKSMLMNILATLGVAGVSKNQEQEKYLNYLRQFMGVSDYEIDASYAYENINNLKNIDSQMIMAKAIREYLFLANNDFDIYDEYVELFDMFRLKDRDYISIDGMISVTYILFGSMGIVETYGNYCGENVVVDKTLPYLNIKKMDKKQISKECAEIYFQNRSKRKHNYYIESSSYVLYEEDNTLVAYHKENSEKKTIIAEGSDIDKMFTMKNITTYQNMVFYVIGNEVYFFNLLNEVNGLVMGIEKKYDKEGDLLPIRNIGVLDGFFICGNDKLCVIDLRTKETKTIYVNDYYGRLGAKDRYILIGNYMYFIKSELQTEKKRDFEAYKIMRYGFKSMKVTDLGKSFIKERYFKDDIVIIGLEKFNTQLVVLLRKNHFGRCLNTSSGEFYCVVMDTENEFAEPKIIDIEGNHKVIGEKYINQLSVYNNHLVFMDHKYEIYTLDFLSDEKNIIKKNCGEDRKDFLENVISISTAVSFGIKKYVEFTDKYENKCPAEIILMGDWLYCEKGDGNMICSIIIGDKK